MTVRVHPFPSRTRQLSSLVPTILGWKRPGTIGKCQHKEEIIRLDGLFSFCVDGNGLHPTLAVPEMRLPRSTLAAFRPLRQPLLAVSATGGARRRCSSRTRQLSSLVPTILGWKRPGKIGRCQHKRQPPRRNPWRFVFCLYHLCFRPLPDVTLGEWRNSDILVAAERR